MNLIIMGAPGAGKGTQAQTISQNWNIPAISTGEILRSAIKEGTALGKSAKSYMDDGKLVPDNIVIGMIKEYLSGENCKNGFILDGFPRSIPQAEALDKMGVKIDAVLSIEVKDNVIVERMSGRRVCPSCGNSYHIVYNPATVTDVCDKCMTKLVIRADDNPETVQNRLNTYHAQTEPLKSFYTKKGCLVTVEGQMAVEDTTALVISALSKFSK